MSDLITKGHVDQVFGDKKPPEPVKVWCASLSGVKTDDWLSTLTGAVQGWLALGGASPGLVVVAGDPPSWPKAADGETWILEGEVFCAKPGVSLRLRAETPGTLSVYAVAEQDLTEWSAKPKTGARVQGPWSGETMWATDDTALGRFLPGEDRSKQRRALHYRTYWHVPDDGAVAPVMTVFQGF